MILNADFLKRLILYSWLLLPLCQGCSGLKYIPPGEKFYGGAEIVILNENVSKINRARLKDGLRTNINLKPNGVFLGNRPGVWFYHLARKAKEEQTVRYYIKTALGSPPALLSQISPEVVRRSMENDLANNGYFNSKVTYQVHMNERRRIGKITFSVTIGKSYKLREIKFPDPSAYPSIPVIATIPENSFLQSGQRYSFDRLNAEILRVEKLLKNAGLYLFSADYLFFEADSTNGTREIDLELKMKRDSLGRIQQVFGIRSLSVITHDTESTPLEKSQMDTLEYEKVKFVYRRENEDQRVNPRGIAVALRIAPGMKYNMDNSQASIRHLMGLGPYKFATMNYTPVHDSLLDGRIHLSSFKKQSLRSEFKVVSKSYGAVGPVLSFTFSNRNFLGNAEKFDVTLTGSYETQVSNQESGTLDAFGLKLESSLTLNKLLQPFRFDFSSAKYIPKTVIKGSANYQNRVTYYNVNLFNASLGYSWRNDNDVSTHLLNALDVSYVKTSNIGEDFQELLDANQSLRNSLQDQFIFGASYTFSYSNQLKQDVLDKFSTFKRNNFFLTTSVDLAGNLLQGIFNNVREEEQTPHEILGSPFAQYFKADIDLRYHWQYSKNNKIATHLLLGTGYAYGNSENMPYIKQYSIGGASSLRAFVPRTVGPGNYNLFTDPLYNSDSTGYTDQYADIKLEASIEHRFKIYKVIHGALYVDAGNIWTVRYDSARQYSQFFFDKFYKQLALGTGLGIRFDFNFFVLRLDTGIALRRPDPNPENQWVIKDIDLRSSDWRNRNVVYNIAIGYPF